MRLNIKKRTSLGKYQAAFLVILVSGFALRLLHWAAVHDHPLFVPEGFLDDAFYHRLGLQAASGDLLAGDRPFFLSPLYIYFLGLVYFLFSPRPASAFLVQCALAAAAICLVYLTCARAGNRKAGLWAALLLALDGPAVMYSCSLLPAGISPFLFALFLYLTVRAADAQSLASWAGVGFGAGLFALDRPNGLLLAAGSALFPAAAGGSARIRKGLCALLAAAFVILPVSARNFAVSGKFTLVSTHGGLNFYLGNRKGASGFYESLPGMPGDVRGQVEQAPGEGAAFRAEPAPASFYGRAWSEIRQAPGSWLRLLARKLFYLINAREAGLNLSLPYLRQEVSPALFIAFVGMWVLVPLAAAGLFLERRNRKVLLVALSAGVYGFSVVLFFISGRYRLPLHVPLAALGGFGACGLARAFRERRTRELMAGLSLVLAFLFISAAQAPVPSGEGQARLQHALRLIERGETDKAAELMKRLPPAALNPFYYRLKLARAYYATGDFARAEGQYRALLEMEPDNPVFLCGLGLTLAASGKSEESEQAFRSAGAGGADACLELVKDKGEKR